jgi:hypothetical protein
MIVGVVMRGNGDGKTLNTYYGHVMTTWRLCETLQWFTV